MARHKTKQQKKASDHRITAVPSISLESITTQKQPKAEKSSTVFLESQVHLLYKDLAKTLLITVVVFFVLLSIFLYMR